MPRLPVLLTRLDDDIPDVADVSARLRRHLMRRRGHESDEAASFSVAGTQRGWGNAGPGKVLDTVLNHRVLNPLVIVDEVEKAGGVGDASGTRHNLTEALLALLEPTTAARWECPFYRVPFDMSGIGWIMTANSRAGLPDPLLSRCPPLVLPPLTLSDLIGFAQPGA